jgi:hypothetical protein
MILSYTAVFNKSNNNAIRQSIINYVYVAYHALSNQEGSISINVILRIVRVTNLATEKQTLLHILVVGL